MTQKERILNSLKAAGGLGVRSDVYIKEFMPRAAARIEELKSDGWDISSTPDGKYVVWVLTNVGSSTENRDQAGTSIPQSVDADLGVASGVADSVTPLPEAPPANPYEYEVWAA